MKYETSKHLHDFLHIQTIKSFGDNIYNGKITKNEADKKQINLLNSILEVYNKAKPRSKAAKEKKSNNYESANSL